MKLTYGNIHNKYDKIGLVAGLGTSLAPFLSKWEYLSKNRKDKYVTFTCNRYYVITKLDADYWVICNPQPKMQIPDIVKEINKRPTTTFVYASSIDHTPENHVKSSLKYDYLPFNQGHKDRKPEMTIQEFLQIKSNYSEKYGYGLSVIVHTLAIALITGCNPIYISGVDFDYSGKGYVNRDAQGGVIMGRIVGPKVKGNVAEDLSILRRTGESIGVEIFTPNKTGYLSNIFKYGTVDDWN